MCPALFPILAVIALSGSVAGQDAPRSDGTASQNAKLAAEFAEVEAKRYRFQRGDEELKAAAETVLRWSNPTDGEVHGAVVVWTHDGCPIAAASVYRFFHKEQINAELVSLSEASLTAERNGRVRWTPEGDVAFRKLPGAPDPAGTPEGRRLQARGLARRFSAAVADRDDPDTLTELRLMARPLRTYAATDDSGRDGAVFALATTNDPEVVLMIESRPADGGRDWYYAAARMNFRGLLLRLDDEVVWDVPQAAPPWDRIRGPEGGYVILEWKTPEAAEAD